MRLSSSISRSFLGFCLADFSGKQKGKNGSAMMKGESNA